MGQFIQVDSNGYNIPSGAQYRGSGWAEVDRGRGQYIQVDSNGYNIPSGAQYRGSGWAEIG